MGFRFQVSGFRVQVSGFQGFRFQGFRFQGFRFQVNGSFFLAKTFQVLKTWKV